MSAPQRRTVRSVSAPYENFLCPLPSAVDGVCMVCRSRANPGWARCWKCDNEALTVGPHTADAVAFVALAPEEGGQRQLAHELYAYKDRDGSPRLITGLGSVLWRWLGVHEDCLARAYHVSAFDVITTVPSSSSRVAGAVQASACPLRRRRRAKGVQRPPVQGAGRPHRAPGAADR